MRYERFIRRVILLAVALATAAVAFCAGASAPAADESLREPLPDRWSYTSPYTQDDVSDRLWWRTLGDPLLDTLIVRGKENNFDILAALKRLEAADALTGVARAGYYPTIGVSAGWEKQRISGATASPARDASSADYFNLGATVSWEVDIFGKITAGVRQRKAQWRASRAQRDAVMVSVSAQIATTYVGYRVAQQQLAVARQHSGSQLRVVRIAEARHEAGLASALDVAQARTVYSSTLATIPQLEAQLNTLRNSLATLVGVYPSQLPAELSDTAALPAYDHMVATGVPADLLRRRPDIAEAEANLAAAAAALGVAKKDFLPSLSINGSISTSAHDGGDLFTGRSFGYSVMPTLSWTLFSGLERKYAVREARAEMEALVDTYNLTVMTAVAETDNAIVGYLSTLRRIEALDEAVAQSRRSYELSVDLYKSGNSSFTNVADAQISYLTYTNELIAAKGSAVDALVNLFKALGGGLVAAD